MKLSLSIFKQAALLLAIWLGIFRPYGAACASDFPRGIYCPPVWMDFDMWDRFDSDSLHHNLVWNYRGAWDIGTGITVDDYLENCSGHGLKSVLRKGDWYWNNPVYEDSIPYFVEYYSYGNYNQLQVDWNYDTAPLQPFGSGYYYWQQAPGTEVPTLPEEGSVLFWSHAQPDTIYNHKFVHTPRYTSNSELLVEPEFDFRGQFGYINKGRTFCARVRLMIDTTGFGNTVDLADTVFMFDFGFRFFGDPDYYRHNWLYLTPDSFNTIGEFQDFWVEGHIDAGEVFHRAIYDFYYCPDNKVDIYVNWVEYMDKEQGYPLFSGDEDLKNATLQKIAEQCSTLQQSTYGDAILGWAQSDEPIRPFFRAHGVVNDFFAATPSLQGIWPRTPFPPGPQRRCDHFFADGEPRLFEVEYYPFLMSNSLGDQVELDSLASKLEQVHETVGDSIPFIFTGQVHWHDGDSTINDLRNPREAEIFAQTYMALAHGAKGITFYKWPSNFHDGAWVDSGLVNLDYEHPDDIFNEKWLAVQDLFAELDSLGNTLLSLDRYASYCAKDGGFVSPVDSVYFEDDDYDYIEVGQFHDASNADYLIIVNRRTDYDRHISVVTNLSGRYALRDLYTQEKFVSSTGNFEWIPFEAGQGRVFKLETYTFWNNNDNFVAADEVLWQGSGALISVDAGKTIKATKSGLLQIYTATQLDCNGAVDNWVTFTALEQSQGWQGLEFIGTGGVDTLEFTKVEYAGDPAIKIRNNREVKIKNSWIYHANGNGLSCDQSSFTLRDSWITDCEGYGIHMGNSSASLIGDSICYNYYGIWATAGSTPRVGHTKISHNNGVGLKCTSGGTIPILLYNELGYPSYGYNQIKDNNNFGVLATYLATPHLGESTNSPGNNSIYGNANYDVKNTNDEVVYAQCNYWGGDPQNSQFDGRVDSSHWLTQEPDFFDSYSPYFSSKQRQSGLNGWGAGNPGDLDEAYRLNGVGVELFLEGEYAAAMDTFDLVVEGYPGTLPARFALNHLVASYRATDDYAGAVTYLNAFLQSPPDTGLVDLALYHEVMNLARMQEYPAAVAIAGNVPMVSSWEAGLLEPTQIELGMMLKYGLENVTSGDSVFQQFLLQYPASDLAFIAAMELGLPWEPRGTLGSGAEGVISAAPIPHDYALYQNFPNPFNSSTTFRYDLPVEADVKLEIFDLRGCRVATLVDGRQAAGYHFVQWDGKNSFDCYPSSGVYLYRLQAAAKEDNQGIASWYERAKKVAMIK